MTKWKGGKLSAQERDALGMAASYLFRLRSLGRILLILIHRIECVCVLMFWFTNGILFVSDYSSKSNDADEAQALIDKYGPTKYAFQIICYRGFSQIYNRPKRECSL
jgi:hypothetical protein